ncbi:MAG: response regulator transcription factor [Clostridia bacterium]|nr:response regulator transcription factor [Clostridia bacterium]
MARILIVEDEKSINDLIRMNLALGGHECEQVYDGRAAVEAAGAKRFDLVILDVMLPGLSGFEVIARIGKVPVIFLSARSGLDDRLRGLALGGDDYIVKPFEMQELAARVEAVLRRTSGGGRTAEFGGISVDLVGRKVKRGGEEIALKPQEFDLLEVLITNRNIALSREKLITLAWGYDYTGDTRTVDVHIQQLRKKLGLEERIKTVYKTGYRLEI